MVTLPGVMLMSIESNRISPSLVTSSGIATTAGSMRCASQHVGGDAEVRQQQFPGEERRQSRARERFATPASTASRRPWPEARGWRSRRRSPTSRFSERDLALQGGPRKREEDAAEQHQGVPPSTARTYSSRCSNCCAAARRELEERLGADGHRHRHQAESCNGQQKRRARGRQVLCLGRQASRSRPPTCAPSTAASAAHHQHEPANPVRAGGERAFEDREFAEKA